MPAIPSNFLICDLDAPVVICEVCGEEHDREFVDVQKQADGVPARQCRKTGEAIKVRQGHKGWLSVRLVKCRVRAMIENELGDEETLIVSRGKDDSGKSRTDQ